MSPATHRATPADAAALANDMSHLVRQALFDALVQADMPADSDHVALTIEQAHSAQAPARLAGTHPGGAPAQAEACALYERCLAHYRDRVRPQDTASGIDDVGAAVAHFVAASMRALHGERATPAMLLRLERQLGGVARRSAAWSTASAADRQNYFEQMAILAVLIDESTTLALTQGTAAMANVQRAASGYLQQLLGMNARELMLDAQGLRVATAALGAQHAA